VCLTARKIAVGMPVGGFTLPSSSGGNPCSGACDHSWTLSGRNFSNRVGFAVISEWKKSQHQNNELGLQCLGSKIWFDSITEIKYMEDNRNTGGIMDEGTALSLLEMRDHLISLYWVIMCCGWAGRGALDCPDLETALRVRKYSLRRPLWTSSFRYL